MGFDAVKFAGLVERSSRTREEILKAIVEAGGVVGEPVQARLEEMVEILDSKGRLQDIVVLGPKRKGWLACRA